MVLKDVKMLMNIFRLTLTMITIGDEKDQDAFSGECVGLNRVTTGQN